MTVERFTIGADDDGRRIDVVIAARTGLSRAQVARLIDQGRVEVDGGPTTRSTTATAGASVVLRPEAPPGPPASEDLAIPIVHADDEIIVVAKPAGVVVHPAPGHRGGTLVNALLAHGAAGGDPERPGIVHRLDAGTSGLMVVAKGQAAYEALVEAMASRRVTRVYHALTERIPETDATTIDAPIGRSPRHRKKMAVVEGGKAARTEVVVLERHPVTALVEARPRTGRTHQIRVHLLAAGTPVAGDAVYGRDLPLARALGLQRPFLHATHLAFDHPLTGEPLAFDDPLPADLQRALEAARSHRG